MSPSKTWVFIRRILRFTLRSALALFFILVVLELAYRNQWIDTYAAGLNSLNEPQDLNGEGRKILVLGDSFSALRESWVKGLRESLPDHHIINASVAGTGIVQANIIAQKRIPQFKPDILIYQIYTGNDLLDYRYPISWSRVNPIRNLYWWWAHRFRSIAWLNQALGQASAGATPAELLPIHAAAFDPAKYTAREKMLLKAEPALIENQAFLKGGRESDMTGYLRRLDEILALCEASGTIPFLLVIPHCAQLSTAQWDNMKALGAEFSQDFHQGLDYPFVNRLAGHVGSRATVLNPLQALKDAEGAGQQLFYHNDPHLNADGQVFLGKWVRSSLANSGLQDDPGAM